MEIIKELVTTLFVVPHFVERVEVQVVVEDQADHTVVVILVYLKHVEYRGEMRRVSLKVIEQQNAISLVIGLCYQILSLFFALGYKKLYSVIYREPNHDTSSNHFDNNK